jgi:hypothetical protein
VRPAVLYGAAALTVLLLAALALSFVGGGPPPTGTAVIEAIPWGTITAIEAEDGERMPLPDEPATPIALTLPVGTYRISLAGPTPGLPGQQVTVQVLEQSTQVAPTVRFPVITVEDYFEQYLASTSTLDAAEETAPIDPAAPAGEAAAPPAAQQPAVAPAAGGVSQ